MPRSAASLNCYPDATISRLLSPFPPFALSPFHPLPCLTLTLQHPHLPRLIPTLTTPLTPTLSRPLSPPFSMPSSQVFINYCKYTVGQGRTAYDESDPKMSSTQFVKLCHDMGLMQPTGPLNVVAVDVVFHKAKAVGQRRLDFARFLHALAVVGDAAQSSAFEPARQLGMQIKPRATFFAPQPVQLRQDTRALGRAEPLLRGSSMLAGSAPGAAQQQLPPSRLEAVSDGDDDATEALKEAKRAAKLAEASVGKVCLN
eukprot:240341-Chlamydomonas_euryale.AAC.26